MYNYEDFLTEKLNKLKETLDIDVNIEIATEQAFVKLKNFTPNTLYIVIKYLASDITFGAKSQPIQILCISEENSLEKARMLLNVFTENNNYLVEIKNGIFTKHQYTTPVVLSNFNEIGTGKRTIFYVSATILILENVIDVNSLMVDGISIYHLGFNLAYQMTPNTQQMNFENLASSMKTTAVLSLGLTTPCISNALTTKVINIINGTNNGNQDFAISFKLGDTQFSNFNYKMTSCSLTTAPNDIPALKLGFIR